MIALVIGIAVTFNIVQDVSTKAATTFSVDNETVNVTRTATANSSALTGFVDGTDFTVLVSSIEVYNSSDCSTHEFTLDTDFAILNNGTSPVLNFTESTFVQESEQQFTCVVYDYQSDSYISDSKARTIINLLPLLVAVVLLTATAAFLG